MNTKNPYINKRVEFHILQSFPVTCLNRDDVGAPKTAMIGGVSRARVSSQCWKRAIRLAMHEVCGVELGIRTKLLSDLVSEACKKIGASADQAKACGDKIEKIFVKAESKKKGDEDADSKADTLMFLSPAEISKIAEAFKEKEFNPDEVVKDPKKPERDLEKIIGKPKFAQADTLDGLDVALFGRMVAQAPSMNVEAAASFSHAISTHRVSNEVEFFTAVADYAKDLGSAHMGSLEFNAATYYRYISLDLGQLYESLGGDQFFSQALSSFIKALYVAVPSARQSTQAGACSWDFAEVLVRKGQGMQLSFETPIKKDVNGGFLQPSIEFLKSSLTKKEKLSGSLFGLVKKFEFGEDENFSIDNLIEGVVSAIKE
jgi:CRISPR system Cascade subunit CasC